MKHLLMLICVIISFSAQALDSAQGVTLVNIPYMERAGLHRDYADALLELALESSRDTYGPYEIVQQGEQTVIRRQLQQLIDGTNLSVAVSMPMPEWLEGTRMVQFPIMKGLASYRLFFAHEENLTLFNMIERVESLKALKIGQGRGWSTAKLLEDNGFRVVYGGNYKALFPMLGADRFQLLMRGAYEIGPEYAFYKDIMPELAIVDGLAIYTYLPMYFFVSEKHEGLAERLEYGLKKAHASGAIDSLFEQYFSEALALLNVEQRKIFYLPNTNIDPSFYEKDKPYLLETIIKREAERNH